MSFKPYICMQTNSTCYQETRQMDIKGVLWHSTGCNNPDLCRYVQPSEGSPNYDEDIRKIGKNTNGNDWNHVDVDAGLNAWIGKFADSSIGTVQAMPWDFRPWGCGAGDNGSCNNGWIQFEICEDNLKNKEYAEAVFEEGCQLTAYLCKIFKLNPNGKADCAGISVPVITCHNEAAKMGLGSNHADINHWFPKLIGKGMPDVRKRVAEILAGEQPTPQPTPSGEKWTGGFPKLPGRGYYIKGDGYKTYIEFKPQIVLIQRFLSWALDKKVEDDGKYGPATTGFVREFQKLTNIKIDGSYGEETKAAAEAFRKSGEKNYYIVQAGDTLSGIAEKFNTTVEELAEKNHIQDPNVIYIGQKIYV